MVPLKLVYTLMNKLKIKSTWCPHKLILWITSSLTSSFGVGVGVGVGVGSAVAGAGSTLASSSDLVSDSGEATGATTSFFSSSVVWPSATPSATYLHWNKS